MQKGDYHFIHLGTHMHNFRNFRLAAFPLAALLLLGAAVALYADTVDHSYFSPKFKRVIASSTLVEKGQPESAYAPEKATDWKQNTAWCEGKPDDGVGEWIDFHFDKVQFSYGLRVYHGVVANSQFYKANNRIKDYELEVRTVTGKNIKVKGTFNDSSCGSLDDREADGVCGYKEGNEIKYDETCIARFRKHCGLLGENYGGTSGEDINLGRWACITGGRLTIKSVYRGTKYRDTCVTDISLISPYHDFMMPKPEDVNLAESGCRADFDVAAQKSIKGGASFDYKSLAKGTRAEKKK